jgi:hypothetical protein
MFDKECKCKETKTCFTTSIRPFNPNYNFGNNVMNYANQPFDQLESGSFNPAKLNNYSTDARALALKAFKTMKTKLPKPKLSATQQASANELAKVLPPEAAALMAAAPAGNSPVGLGMGRPVSLDKLSPETKKKVATAINSQYQSNGSGFDQASNDQENSFQMPTLGQKSSSEDNIEVLKFAEKAVDGADVNKAPETPIFDIISNRYRRSGWNKIESTEMKAQ